MRAATVAVTAASRSHLPLGDRSKEALMSSPQINRRTLAAFESFPDDVRTVVHDVLLGYPDVLESLTANPSLRPEVCHRLYAKKAPAMRLARNLVHQVLPDETRELVIRRERRANVLEAYFEHNIPSDAEQEALAQKASPAGARLMLDRYWLRPDLRRDLALKCKGRELMREMAYGLTGAFTDREILDCLGQWDTWGLHRRPFETRMMLISLFSRRPELIPAAAKIGFGHRRLSVLAAMAASTELRKQDIAVLLEIGEQQSSVATFARTVYAPLIENPRTPLAVVELIRDRLDRTGRMMVSPSVNMRENAPEVTCQPLAIDDVETLKRMVHAAAPLNRLIASPATLLELTANPLVQGQLRERVTAAWASLRGGLRVFAWTHEPQLLALGVQERWRNGNATWRSYVHAPSEEMRHGCELAATALGSDRQRWETLIALMDEYEGDLPSLIDLALTL
jgi:hypothetical protein